MTYTYDYPRPAVTADIVVLKKNDENYSVLLIERKHDPFEGSWALPGGFLNMDETLEEAALRELEEETGILATGEELILVGSETTRDTFVDHYLLRRDLPLSEVRLQPGETADAKWVSLAELDAKIADLSLAKPIGEQFNGIRERFLLFLKEK